MGRAPVSSSAVALSTGITLCLYLYAPARCACLLFAAPLILPPSPSYTARLLTTLVLPLVAGPFSACGFASYHLSRTHVARGALRAAPRYSFLYLWIDTRTHSPHSPAVCHLSRVATRTAHGSSSSHARHSAAHVTAASCHTRVLHGLGCSPRTHLSISYINAHTHTLEHRLIPAVLRIYLHLAPRLYRTWFPHFLLSALRTTILSTHNRTTHRSPLRTPRATGQDPLPLGLHARLNITAPPLLRSTFCLHAFVRCHTGWHTRTASRVSPRATLHTLFLLYLPYFARHTGFTRTFLRLLRLPWIVLHVTLPSCLPGTPHCYHTTLSLLPPTFYAF